MTEAERKRGVTVSRPRRRLYESLPETAESLPAPAATPPPDEAAGEAMALPDSDPSGQEAVVRHFARLSMGTALLPLPIVDFAAGSAIQLKMIQTLAGHYHVKFEKERTRAMVGALIGGFHIGLLTGSLLKWVPVIGLAGGVVSSAAVSYGITYALGMLFLRHFEAGGTLLDFNLPQARKDLPTAYCRGRNKVGLAAQA